MNAPTSKALLLTGSVGSGKTTLAKETGELLRAAGVAHAVIELDWLSWCSPPGDGAPARRQLLLDNLRSVRSHYQQAGIDRFVLAGSIVSPEHLRGVDRALALPLTIVRVSAPLEVIANRVDRRDPASKTIASVADLAAFDERVRAAVPDCPHVDNSDADVVETARRVLHAAGWERLLHARR
jgi:adenylylsulfate kinase